MNLVFFSLRPYTAVDVLTRAIEFLETSIPPIRWGSVTGSDWWMRVNHNTIVYQYRPCT